LLVGCEFVPNLNLIFIGDHNLSLSDLFLQHFVLWNYSFEINVVFVHLLLFAFVGGIHALYLLA